MYKGKVGQGMAWLLGGLAKAFKVAAKKFPAMGWAAEFWSASTEQPEHSPAM
jgi:hypothetical protein